MSDALERVAAPLGRRAVASTHSTDLAELLASVPATLQHRSTGAPGNRCQPPQRTGKATRRRTGAGETPRAANLHWTHAGRPSAPLQRTRASQQAPARRRNSPPPQRRNAGARACSPSAANDVFVDASQPVLLLCRCSSMATRLREARRQVLSSLHMKFVALAKLDANRLQPGADLVPLQQGLDTAKSDLISKWNAAIDAAAVVVPGGCWWGQNSTDSPHCPAECPDAGDVRRACVCLQTSQHVLYTHCALPHVLCRSGCTCRVSGPV